MDLEKFEHVIDFLFPHGLSIVSYSGGEPTIWPHLKESIKYCHERSLLTQLTSNGISLSLKKIDNLASAGLDYLNLSADSYENLDVSPKTAKENIPKLKHAKDSGMIVACNVTLNRKNVFDLERILSIADDAGVPVSIGIVGKSNSADVPWNANDYLFREDELQELSKYLLGLYRKHSILDPKEYFKSLTVEDKREVWDCSLASKRSVHVNPKGELLPCLKLRYQSDLNLENVVVKERVNTWRREKKIITSNRSDGCNKNCYSNCAYASYYFNKHPLRFVKNLKYCLHYF